MPPRPTPIARSKYNNNRLSAVYIGSNPSVAAAHFASSSPLAYTSPTIDGSSVPDLPEPPSPVGSDTGSGLPSPPATNSTGSTDDTQTLEDPERPLSFTSSSGSSTSTGGGSFSPKVLAASGPGLSSMRRGASGTRSLHRSSSSISSVVSTTSRNGRFDEGLSRSTNGGDTPGDLDLERLHHNGQGEGSSHMTHDEEEGDDTARLDLRRSIASTTDDVLQRAKSLTQRNRMVRSDFFNHSISNTEVLFTDFGKTRLGSPCRDAKINNIAFPGTVLHLAPRILNINFKHLSSLWPTRGHQPGYCPRYSFRAFHSLNTASSSSLHPRPRWGP